jgi:Zn-dependent oligopeptidase
VFAATIFAGTFTAASSVQLRNLMRVAEAEGVRKSAYEGLRSIGPFVSESLIGIIKDRNKLAKLLGFDDFYDYKVGCVIS